MNRIAGRWLLTISTLVSAAPAHAWGPQGHRVIAKVAEGRLTPAAKSAVRSLLHEGDTLADIAGWADHEGHDAVPGSASWHYVNVPITAARYDSRDCSRGECVVEKIKHFHKVLADSNAPRRDRQRALLFLVHFVADVHQPMHVGDNRDRGGNLTQIQFFNEGTNLHRMWDSDLIHRIGGNDHAWIERVEERITPETEKAWSAGTVEDWTNDSLRAAKLAYQEREGAPGPMPSGTFLGAAYLKRADPILREQMARAAVRLAHELNTVFSRTDAVPSQRELVPNASTPRAR